MSPNPQYDLSSDKLDEYGSKPDKVWPRLARYTVFIPPLSVMPELEGHLLPAVKDQGRVVELPQASIRLAWVLDGLGAGIVHGEKHLLEKHKQSIGSIDLSEQIKTTKIETLASRVTQLESE